MSGSGEILHRQRDRDHRRRRPHRLVVGEPRPATGPAPRCRPSWRRNRCRAPSSCRLSRSCNRRISRSLLRRLWFPRTRPPDPAAAPPRAGAARVSRSAANTPPAGSRASVPAIGKTWAGSAAGSATPPSAGPGERGIGADDRLRVVVGAQRAGDPHHAHRHTTRARPAAARPPPGCATTPASAPVAENTSGAWSRCFSRTGGSVNKAAHRRRCPRCGTAPRRPRRHRRWRR